MSQARDDEVGTVLPFVKPWRELKAFTRTAARIYTHGIPPGGAHTLAEQPGVMRPLRFNIYQSLLCGTVSSYLLARLEGADEPIAAADSAGLTLEYFERVLPFSIPLGLLLTAYVMGYLSLQRQERTPESIKASRDSFLYLDAAYGWPLQLWPVFGALFFEPTEARYYAPPLSVYVFVYWYVIAKRLARANGYSWKQNRLFEERMRGYQEAHTATMTGLWKRAGRRVPWARYTMGYMILAPLLWCLMVAAIFGLSYLAAATRMLLARAA